MVENHGNSTDSDAESQSSRRPWTQIVPAESEPIAIASETTDNFGMAQGNVERKPAWNRPSNGDSGISPVMGALTWPTPSETTKAPSTDSFKSLGDGSPSAPVPLSQAGFAAELNYNQQRYMKQTGTSASSNGTVAQTSSDPFPRGQNQRNDFASQSHVGTQNQYQRNSYKNQNGNHHPHQSHGGRRNQEHGNQNWNLHRNFNGRGGFAKPPRGFVRPAPHMPLIHAQFMLPHQPMYHFGGPMVFPELPLMHYPHRMPLIEPPPIYFQVQEVPLETKIRNQVHYYFSDENLPSDDYLRKRMNDEGFVHIQFIAGFNQLKKLTNNIQLIMDSLQGSNVVELQGYEIRSKHMWRRFLWPVQSRIRFIPSSEFEMFSKMQNLSNEQKSADEMGSSSRADKKNNSVGGYTFPSNPHCSVGGSTFPSNPH